MTSINSGFTPDLKWASRLGASYPRFRFLGTAVPAADPSAGTIILATHAVPCVRGKVSFASLPQTTATTAQLGQPINHNYMTRVYAVGEGASGPPTHREPA